MNAAMVDHQFYWEEESISGRWCPVAGPAKPTVKHDRVALNGGVGPRVRRVTPIAEELRGATLDRLRAEYGE